MLVILRQPSHFLLLNYIRVCNIYPHEPSPSILPSTSPSSRLIISHLPSVDELFKNLVALPPLSRTLTASPSGFLECQWMGSVRSYFRSLPASIPPASRETLGGACSIINVESFTSCLTRRWRRRRLLDLPLRANSTFFQVSIANFCSYNSPVAKQVISKASILGDRFWRICVNNLIASQLRKPN